MAPQIHKPIPGWVPPAKTIIMATSRRSGSYYLADLCKQTMRLGTPAEFFNKRYIRRRLSRLDENQPLAVNMCLAVRQFGATENDVVAIKLFPDHFEESARTFRLTEWFPEPRWVWLRRRDILGQAISHTIARQTDKWVSLEQAGSDTTVYDKAGIMSDLQRACMDEARWRAFFARNETQPLELWYEDVFAAPSKAVMAIADYADVDLGGAAPVEPSKFAVQRTDLNQDWRDRFLADMGSFDHIERLSPKVRASC